MIEMYQRSFYARIVWKLSEKFLHIPIGRN